MEIFKSFVCMLVCINLKEGIAAQSINELEVNQSIFNTSYTHFSYYLTSIQITPVNDTVNMSSTSIQTKPVNDIVNMSSTSIQTKPVNDTVNMSSTSIQTMPINYADNVSPTSIQVTPVNYTEDVFLVKSTFGISNVVISTTFMNIESYNFPINVNTQINNLQSFSFNTINSSHPLQTLSQNVTSYFTSSVGPTVVPTVVPTAKTTASTIVMKTFKIKYDLDFNATIANLSGIINATDVFCKPWLSFNIAASINCSISDGSVFVISQVRGSQDNLNLYESNVRSSLTSNSFNVMVYNNQFKPDPTLTVIDQSTTEPAASSTLNNKSYIVIIVVVVIILISIIIIGAFVHLSKKKKRKVKTKVSSTSSMKELQLNAPLNHSKRGGNTGNQNQAFEE
ncbi:uncharacterized protein LOC105844297 isoform X2 [Hydra vulgaris]|uniref:Uncharacterized protein LOC105844297 isoform X2 n=1 Tax=Hydra vulgaris TaxID=6087 RepID=A0ABM4BTK6_HYDVU